jgi:hypothetical protein
MLTTLVFSSLVAACRCRSRCCSRRQADKNLKAAGAYKT